MAHDDSEPGWTVAAPADERAVDELMKTAPRSLPKEYFAFLMRSNGGEGELPVQPLWFVMWAAEEVVTFNREYKISDQLPGFVGFGTSGGGELLAFDVRDGQQCRVVSIPFIPMDADDAIEIAPSFAAFERMMGVSMTDDAE